MLMRKKHKKSLLTETVRKKQKKSLLMEMAPEMVAEILAKLPMNVIRKVRCVCRKWHSLIGEPYFIQKQLVFSHSVAIKARNHIITQKNGKFYALNAKDFAPQSALRKPKRQKLKFPTVESESKFILKGSCNGLLCLSALDKILFWNPSIHRFKVIPKLQSQIQKGLEFGGCMELLGFGFVSQECDYKLLRFENRVQIHIGFPEVEIYSLKNDTWKCLPSISNNYSYQIDYSYNPFPFSCVKHNLYSIARRGRGHNEPEQHIVLVFNMYEEKFQEIFLPETNYIGKNLAVRAYKDSITVIVARNQNWDIWVMEETNVQCNWRKMFHFQNMFLWPYDMTNNGKVILCMYGLHVVYFDPETGSMREFTFQSGPERAVIYNESLALMEKKSTEGANKKLQKL